MSHLSNALREGTQNAHTLAENTIFMKCATKGVIEREPLRKLFANLYFVYSTLEAELKREDNPILHAIYFPALNRTEALMSDLAFYYGENWRSQITASEAGLRYVDRIQTLANTNPTLLIAHSYTRYMGDLSGGQHLKNVIRVALSLPPNQGTQFYEFAQIATPEARRLFKERYRASLDSLALSSSEIEQIVAEANFAFALNRDVLHELETDVRTAIDPQTLNLLIQYDRPGSTAHSTPRESVLQQ